MALASSQARYPRVLSIDAAAFHRRANLGILKSNLFEGWPQESLAQIIIGQDEPDFALCSNNWRITRDDRVHGRMGHRLEASAAVKSSAATPVIEPPDRLRMHSPLQQALQLLGYLPWAGKIRLSDDLRSWIAEFRPEVIFTYAASMAVFKVLHQVAAEFKLPVVPFFTDDWIQSMYLRGTIDRYLRHRLQREFSEMLARSPLALTASEAMAEEYALRYGAKFQPCMDMVDLAQRAYTPYKFEGGEVRFLFAGFLEPDRWRSLVLLKDALVELREEGMAARLDIYTFPSEIARFGEMLEATPVVHVHPAVPFDQVVLLQLSADVLVHVEAFSLDHDPRITLSMSTKIPQYMASGRAILGVGPTSAASLRYVDASGAGCVVNSESKEELKQKLRLLLSDHGLREQMSATGRQVALDRHDARSARVEFRSYLTQAAECKH